MRRSNVNKTIAISIIDLLLSGEFSGSEKIIYQGKLITIDRKKVKKALNNLSKVYDKKVLGLVTNWLNLEGTSYDYWKIKRWNLLLPK